MIDPIVSIVGKSNSEKATLIDRLVDHFSRSDFSISVIKEKQDDFQLDKRSDFILIKDSKENDLPKIEVFDYQLESSLIHNGMENVVAIVSDSFVNEEEVDIPVFKKDDIQSLAEFLELEFMIKPSRCS